jgi:hypothetical protein
MIFVPLIFMAGVYDHNGWLMAAGIGFFVGTCIKWIIGIAKAIADDD